MALVAVGVLLAAVSLSGLSPLSSAQAVSRGDLATGERVYKQICFVCHGMKGDGKGPTAESMVPRPQVFTDSSFMSRVTDEYMFYVVKYGKLPVLKREIPDSNFESLTMPAFGHLFEDREIRELIKFVWAFTTGEPQSPEWREIFVQACATCHGEKGRGDGERAVGQPPPDRFVSEGQPPPADLTDPVLMARFPDDFLFALIKEGSLGVNYETTPAIGHAMTGYRTMLPFSQALSDEEIWSVIQYIRETFIKDP